MGQKISNFKLKVESFKRNYFKLHSRYLDSQFKKMQIFYTTYVYITANILILSLKKDDQMKNS